MSAAYSRGRLAGQLDQLYFHARKFMSDWKVGDTYAATPMSRRMINAQISPLSVSVNSQDIIDDLMVYRERALNTHIVKALPKFMLRTPAMKRRAKAVDTLLERVQSVHTSAQRAGSPRDLADDIPSLHASDPQFVPESNLRFALSEALIASVYFGDVFSFTLYSMASQPALYARIQSEADALFGDGDPDGKDFTLSAIDVAHRFLMECLRMYTIYIAQTASHYMSDVFPDTFAFDIDRYKPPRNEHFSPGCAPYGLGTRMCLGFRLDGASARFPL